MKKEIIFLSLFLMQTTALAQYLPWEILHERFSKVSQNTKALSHVQCFMENYDQAIFQLKEPKDKNYFNRCFAKPEISLESERIIAIIDYTVESNQKRMFLIDRLTGEISTMAVAHGRYKAGFFNRRLKENKNSIREIKYYSNEINSMATSSGFFIAGQDHIGPRWGRSLVIHGLESGINDNACERDVVIHGAFTMTKSKAYMLSSGCPMVSPFLIDHVVNLLRGKSDEEMRLENSGSLVFIYGLREKNWIAGTCPGQFSFAQL